MEIGIIGKGRVGGALCRHLAIFKIVKGRQDLGRVVSLIESCEVIFLTVPDRSIGEVAKYIASQEVVLREKVFFHCSGSLGLEPLKELQDKGAHVGSLHPLQSFAGGMADFRNVYMAVDGDKVAQDLGMELAKKLGALAFHVPAAERQRYHAAACMTSNYLVTLMALASKLMSQWTGSEKAALSALLPLLDGTVANLHLSESAGEALTGPIARADISTVTAHLAVLPSEYQEVYRLLGIYTAQLANQAELINEEQCSTIVKVLNH